jgi:hypothetical protein
MSRKICEYADCDNYMFANGVCNKHRYWDEMSFDEDESEKFWEFVKKELRIRG